MYEFFGGEQGRPNQMKMIWHNLSFDEEKQIGMGEYSFEMSNKNHGVAVIKVEGEKISNWREYQWTGDLDFESFIGENKF